MSDTTVNKLNELLEKNYDAEKGYKKAAENVKSNVLKTYLESRSNDRYQFGHEIKSEINRLGGDPDKGGSVTGALHRTWIDVKSAFATQDDKAVLQECERGEKASLEEYNEVLANAELPGDTRNVIQKHRDSIQSSLSQIETVENSL